MTFRPHFVDSVLDLVFAEREAQDAQWGEQNHPDGTGTESLKYLAGVAKRDCQRAALDGRLTYRHILDEEVAEAFAETDPIKLKTELIQVAAVAVAWVEKLIREEERSSK
ncbi:hypothetical protein JF714_15680 [Mycobacterium avium]|uniref:hypothetical protein n=1 Tax=Mycobacterium avium TaxID=1764 RepID=UPI001CDA95AD|nr:hypothetical protein [Mycobacterium avium]MCA2331883.1 hypothetical protein [Mycobacterium avium]